MLAFTMVVGSLPVSVFADEAEGIPADTQPVAEGTISEEEPLSEQDLDDEEEIPEDAVSDGNEEIPAGDEFEEEMAEDEVSVPSYQESGRTYFALNWSDIQKWIDTVESPVHIMLRGDPEVAINPGDDNTTITNNGKVVTIDFDGRTLDCQNREMGAFFNQSGTLRLMNGTIKDAASNYGGGINNQGELILEDMTISGCIAHNKGGAIMNYGTLIMTGGTITGCAAGSGGAIFNMPHGSSTSPMARAADVTLINVTLSGNGAIGTNNESGNGAGIAVVNGSLTMSGCTVSGGVCSTNSGNGGGIFFDSEGKTMSLDTNTKIINNVSGDNGGGICVTAGSAEINDCKIEGNFCRNDGDGLYIGSDAEVSIGGETSVTSNIISGGSQGMGIYQGGTLNLSGTPVITDNGSMDLYLPGDRIVNITGTLSDDAKIYVSAANTPRRITSGFASSGTESEDVFAGGTGFTITRDGDELSAEGTYYIDRYFDYEDKVVKEIRRSVDPNSVREVNSTMSYGIYIVSKDTTFNSRIEITGSVELIIPDGVTLTANKGIHFPGGDSKTLIIYGQENDTGKLIARSGSEDQAAIGGNLKEPAGKMIINGGEIEARGYSGSSGIGNGSLYKSDDNNEICVYGGKLSAWGSYGIDFDQSRSGAAIGGSYGSSGCVLAVYGGQVNATAKKEDDQVDAAAIGGGSYLYHISGSSTYSIYPGDGDSFVYYGGYVTAIGGHKAPTIGCGVVNDELHWTANPGTVSIQKEDAMVMVNGTRQQAADRTDACRRTDSTIIISPCDHQGHCHSIDDSYHSYDCPYCGQQGTERHVIENYHCALCGYDCPSYPVTCTVKGGEGTVTADKETAREGETVTITIVPADGYCISRSYTAVTLSTSYGKQYLTPVNGVCSFTARDVAMSVSVTLVREYQINCIQPEHGSLETDITKGVSYYDTVTITATPDEGYRIKSVMANGTPVNPDGNGSYKFTIGTSDVTVTAEFEKAFTVSFDPADGNPVESLTVADGEAVNEPDTPVREGYSFLGWYLGDDLYDFDLPVTGDIVLVAHWQQECEHLAGHSLSLDGDIGVNFYMDLTDEVIAHKDTAYMKFTVPDGTAVSEKNVFVKAAVTDEVDGHTYYVFKCNVSAKEMNSEIKAQIIDGEYEGTEYSYTVRKYAQYILENDDVDEYAAAVPLVRALLNYGAYAQLYFGNNTENLANDGVAYTSEELDNVSFDNPGIVNGITSDNVTFAGVSLSLESETTLSLYFLSNDGSELNMSCDTNAISCGTAGDYQIARIRGISANEIGGSYTVTVDGAGTVTCSPLTYCALVIGGTYQKELKDVCRAFVLYYQAAAAFNAG